MRTVEATLQVTEDGQLEIQLPEEEISGRYKVIFVLKNAIAPLRKSVAAFDYNAFRESSSYRDAS